MTINLLKGQKADLTRNAPDLTAIRIGLGWDQRSGTQAEFDLDAVAIMLFDNGKARNDSDLIFYHNPRSICGSVVYNGDNRTGEGEGDDETIDLCLTLVPEEITRIQIIASIYEAQARQHHFGMVENAYIRAMNPLTNEVLCSFNLTEDYSRESCIVMAEVYRHHGEWKFSAVGSGYQNGLIGALHTAGLA